MTDCCGRQSLKSVVDMGYICVNCDTLVESLMFCETAWNTEPPSTKKEYDITNSLTHSMVGNGDAQKLSHYYMKLREEKDRIWRTGNHIDEFMRSLYKLKTKYYISWINSFFLKNTNYFSNYSFNLSLAIKRNSILKGIF